MNINEVTCILESIHNKKNDPVRLVVFKLYVASRVGALITHPRPQLMGAP